MSTTTRTKLAIEGGVPVRTRPWPRWPVWDERDEAALLGVLRSGAWGMVQGSAVGEFEAAWARFQQARWCVAVASGSAALEVALRALGVGPGDEVILPAYTFVATAAAVLLAGAVPIFADIDAASYELDPAAVEAAVGPRTRVIIPVHIAGCPADLDGILAVARRHGLRVLEDAAQAHGAAWRGRRVGALGDLGTFSFQASKNLNAGEGGAIVTNDEALFRQVWSLHNVGRTLSDDWRTSGWYQHDLLGSNYRLTAFQAALLRSQMTRLEEQMAQRERAAAFLDRELAAIPGLRPQVAPAGVTAHAHHLYIVRYDAQHFGGHTRDDFVSALRAEGVPASGGYTVPLQRSPAVVRATTEICARLGRTDDPLARSLPVTERACTAEGVWLPQSVLLADEADLADIPRAAAKLQAAWGM